MKTITSKLSPPNEKCCLEITYQRRDGTQFKYISGGADTEHERKRECGGCAFCIGEIEVKNTRDPKKRSYGTSHPRFYRQCEPCAQCAPKLERLHEIDRQIAALSKERIELL